MMIEKEVKNGREDHFIIHKLTLDQDITVIDQAGRDSEIEETE